MAVPSRYCLGGVVLEAGTESGYTCTSGTESGTESGYTCTSFGWDAFDAFTQHDVQELDRVLCDNLEVRHTQTHRHTERETHTQTQTQTQTQTHTERHAELDRVLCAQQKTAAKSNPAAGFPVHFVPGTRLFWAAAESSGISLG
eukprot:320527-Rhodomonas_salina.1